MALPRSIKGAAPDLPQEWYGARFEGRPVEALFRRGESDPMDPRHSRQCGSARGKRACLGRHARFAGIPFFQRLIRASRLLGQTNAKSRGCCVVYIRSLRAQGQVGRDHHVCDIVEPAITRAVARP
jgi:hypothetical protein